MAEVLAVGPVVSPDAAARLIAACGAVPVFTPSGTGSLVKQRQRRRARLAAVGGPNGRPTPDSDRRRFAPRSPPTGRRQEELLRQGGLRGALTFAAVG